MKNRTLTPTERKLQRQYNMLLSGVFLTICSAIICFMAVTDHPKQQREPVRLETQEDPERNPNVKNEPKYVDAYDSIYQRQINY